MRVNKRSVRRVTAAGRQLLRRSASLLQHCRVLICGPALSFVVVVVVVAVVAIELPHKQRDIVDADSAWLAPSVYYTRLLSSHSQLIC